MKKRILSILMALIMCMSLLPTAALAAEGGEERPACTCETQCTEERCAEDCPVCAEDPALCAGEEPGVEPEPVSATETVTQTYIPDADALPDNDELFAEYVEQMMYAGFNYGISLFGSYGLSQNVLNEKEQAIYSELKTAVGKIAAGQVGSTVINISADLGIEDWTTEKIGDDLNAEAAEKFNESIDTGKIIDCLLVDCPYELYWYNKTSTGGCKTNYQIRSVTSNGSTTVSISALSFTFAVSQDYAVIENGQYNPSVINTTKTGATSVAVNKANAIIEKYADASDYDKLVGYKNEICSLVSYNTDAANATNNYPYGDPWQLIYVFDENTTNQVVCEGYAKAFQYLCDLTTFEGDVTCYTVTGNMSGDGINGAGEHMWNIVTLEGKNYLVDVTNSDAGTVGADGGLFLVGANANASGSYTFLDTTFTYDDDTISLYSGTDILNLSQENYTPPALALNYSDMPVSLTIDDSVNLTASVTNGTAGATYTYAVTEGSLPSDLSIDKNTGAITGTLTAYRAETTSVTITATETDSNRTATCEITFPAVAKKANTVTFNSNALTQFYKDDTGVYYMSGSTCTAISADTFSATATGGTVTYTYSSDGINYSDSLPGTVGTWTVKASVTGDAVYADAEATHRFEIVAKAVESITVTAPTKTEYVVGQTLDTAGMVVTAVYNDGTTGALTAGEYATSPTTLESVGTQTITVTYGSSITTSFEVTVIARSVTNIEVTTQPTTKTYSAFDTFNRDGMVVTATYNDGTTASVANYDVSYPDNRTSFRAGDTTITITYAGQSTAVTVTVNKKQLDVSGASWSTSTSFTYDGTEKSVVLAGIPEGVVPSYTDNTKTYAGSYTASVSFAPADSANYEVTGSVGPCTWSITAAEQTPGITSTASLKRGSNALDLSTLVSNAQGSVSFVLSGSGDTGSSLSGTTLTSGGVTGTVQITVNIAAKDVDGDGTNEYNAYTRADAITVTITEKDTAALPVSQTGCIYGETLAAPTVTKPAAAGEVTYSYTGTLAKDNCAFGPSATAPTEAGSYTVTATCEDSATVYTGTADFAIAPKSINSGSVTITLGTAPVYTGGEQSVSIISVNDGSVTLNEDTDYTVASGNTATNVESTVLTITGKGNYTGEKTATWSLQKAAPAAGDFTVPAPAAVDYTGDPVTVSAPTTTATGMGTVTVKYNGSATAPTDAGSYAVTFDVAEGDNYIAATGLAIGTLTINKADYTGTREVSDTVRSNQTTTDKVLPLPALPDGASYGTPAGTGDFVTAATVAATTLTYSTAGKDAGTFAVISIPVTGATNYNDYTVEVTITAVDKTAVTISGISVASKTYDGSPVIPGGTAAITGGDVSADTLVYTYTSTDGGAYNSTAAPKDVGAYKLTISVPSSNDTYMGSTEIPFSITAKELTITGLTAADRDYDGTVNVTLTGGVLNGVVGGENVTVTMPVSGTIPSAAVENGKTVAVAKPALEGADAGNYILADLPVITVNITQAVPDIGTVSYTGGTIYPSADPAAVTLTRSNETIPGTLALAAGTAFTAGTSSYNWVFTPGDSANYQQVTGTVSLTVAADTLESISIGGTAPDKTTYQYGEAFETAGLTVTAAFASGRTANVTGNVTFGALTVGQTSVELSYTSDGVTKTCTVNGITVQKADAPALSNRTVSVKYNETAAQTVSLAGLMPADAGDTLTYAEGTKTDADGIIAGWSVGTDGVLTYSLTSGLTAADAGKTATLPVTIGSTNYENSTVSVIITLTNLQNQAPLAITNGTTVTYGNTLALTTSGGSGSGAVTFTVTDGTGAATVSGGTLTATRAGTVTVTAAKASDGTYAAITSAPVTITITPASIADAVVTLDPAIAAGSAKDDEVRATTVESVKLNGILLTAGTDYTVTIPTGMKKAGSYPVTVTGKGNYTGTASATFVINPVEEAPVLPPELEPEDGEKFKVAVETGLSEVPAAFVSNPALNTPVKIETELKTEITENTSIPEENTAVYEVTLMVSRNGGTWEKATADNFPSDGKLTVTLPYPDGTDSRYTFTVVHMFTTADFGKTPGATETPKVTNTADGIRFTVTGLSPISVGWTEPQSSSTGSSGGSSVSAVYSITVEDAAHGAVRTNRTRAASGTTVTLTVTADRGYELGDLVVTDSRGNELKLTDKGDGKYTFKMPGRRVTVEAVFVPVEIEDVPGETEDVPAPVETPCDGGARCPSRAFPDLDPTAWYHLAVDFVIENGLMGGYDTGLFGPNDNLSRAELAQILYNMEGRPAVTGESVFEDVADGAWYTDAILWASANGIVEGNGNNRFCPDNPIVREELAVMLYRYAVYKGMTAVTLEENLAGYPDAGDVSGFAIQAMNWAVGRGVINGNGSGGLDPRGSASRAVVAQMLKNFAEI